VPPISELVSRRLGEGSSSSLWVYLIIYRCTLYYDTINIAMIINIHEHLWGSDAIEPYDIVEVAERYGFDITCISKVELPGGRFPKNPTRWECRSNNLDVYRLVKSHHNKFLGFCLINPLEAGAVDDFEGWIKDEGFRGLKLYTSVYADDPSVDPLAEKAAELGVPILFHVEWAWPSLYPRDGRFRYDPSPSDKRSNGLHIARLAKRHPDTVIINGHVNMLGQDWEASIKAVGHCPNVYADLSGSGSSRGCVEFAVRELGAGRCLFGTDGSIAPTLGAVRGACISDEERDLVLSGNARRILNI